MSKLFYFFYFSVSTLFLFNQVCKIFQFFNFDVTALFIFNQVFELLIFVQVFPNQSKFIMIFLQL